MARRNRSRRLPLQGSEDRAPDLVCLSHLRWNYVYQRPQHLLSRCARERRVFYVEEPMLADGPARMEVHQHSSGVWTAVPHLPHDLSREAAEAAQKTLLDKLMEERDIRRYMLWYYTPMALGFSRHLEPLLTIYDCMDELSMFKNAPPLLQEREVDLFRRADLIFTGGQSLYEAKRHRHPSVHLFPSSVDVEHFRRARSPMEEPLDQVTIPHPRLGYFGVIDERMDLDLLAGIADARRDWNLIVLGPVAKIGLSSLPRRSNIYYLGNKPYQDLPDYLAGWDVAMLPFARNESTRFISPTKTPEYLAGGKPVVSAPIHDVIRPYAEMGLVLVADGVEEFVRAVEATLARGADAEWLQQVDAMLAQNSWDRTWARMRELIELGLTARRVASETRMPKGQTTRGRSRVRGPLPSVQLDKGQGNTFVKPN